MKEQFFGPMNMREKCRVVWVPVNQAVKQAVIVITVKY